MTIPSMKNPFPILISYCALKLFCWLFLRESVVRLFFRYHCGFKVFPASREKRVFAIPKLPKKHIHKLKEKKKKHAHGGVSVTRYWSVIQGKVFKVSNIRSGGGCGLFSLTGCKQTILFSTGNKCCISILCPQCAHV